MVSKLLILLTLVSASAELIPASRLVDWDPNVTIGVLGGIPNRLTNGATVVDLTSSIDTNGVVDASGVILAAYNAAASNTCIFLPAGRIRMNSAVTTLKNGITIRGAGRDLTEVMPSGTAVAFGIGSNPDYQWNWPPPPDNTSATILKGESNITVTSSLPLSPTWIGLLLRISQTNDLEYPILSTTGFERVRKQTVIITDVSGNVFTFWPPSVMDWTNAPTFAIANNVWKMSGVEHMTITFTNTTGIGGVGISQGFSCWVKDVKLNRARNYGSSIGDSVMCELRGVWVNRSEVDGPPGNNHYGLSVGYSTGAWIENCIAYEQFPNMEINGAVGSAFSYNFIASSFWAGHMNVNHNTHCSGNLYEGNVTPNMQSDGYWGSEGNSTYLRNWFYGTYEGGGADQQVIGGYYVALNRFTREASFVGNIVANYLTNFTYRGYLMMGKPHISNDQFNGLYGPPWLSTNIPSAPITYTQSGLTVTASAPFFTTNHVGLGFLDMSASEIGLVKGYIAEYTSSTQVILSLPYTISTPAYFLLNPGSGTEGGWLELDTNVVHHPTRGIIWKGNYIFPQGTPQIPSQTDPFGNPDPTTFGQALGGDTVPASYLYGDTPPAWWPSGLTNWPAIATNNLPTNVTGLPTNNIFNLAQATFYGANVSGELPPTISVQPADDTIDSGETATMFVVASGSPTLTYQWYEGISGDTSDPVGGETAASFTTPELTETTTYWVRVTNDHGSDDSITATITVNPSDPINTLLKGGLIIKTGTTIKKL